jgi:hypothetical protein
VCNIKMDVENSPQIIYVHAYGTLMKPKMAKKMEAEYFSPPTPEMMPMSNQTQLPPPQMALPEEAPMQMQLQPK